MRSFDYTITDDIGVHARPAGMLAKAARDSGCEVTISRGDRAAPLRKLMAVMSLGIKKGDAVTVTVEGDGEERVCEELRALFAESL